jgi:HPt (histidine-containing phosphotransfer) domain-containing protein
MSSYVDQTLPVGIDRPLILDRGSLDTFMNDICGGNLDTISDLVQIYLQSLDDLLEEMVAAWKTEDHVILRRSAHSLKSSSRIFGADLLAENCERLEKAVLAGELANAPTLIDRIVKQGQQMHHLLVIEFDELNHEE